MFIFLFLIYKKKAVIVGQFFYVNVDEQSSVAELSRPELELGR